MNRSHNSVTATQAIELIKDNFKNFSIDLIYGIPESSFDIWKKNIDIGLKYDVPHISTYVLTVEPKTALIKLIEKNKIKEVSDTDQKLQFEYVYDYLSGLGYINYEFSSFAKPYSIMANPPPTLVSNCLKKLLSTISINKILSKS